MYYSIFDEKTKQLVACGIGSTSIPKLRESILKYLKPYLESREAYYILKNNNLKNILAQYRCSVAINSEKFPEQHYTQKMSEIFK